MHYYLRSISFLTISILRGFCLGMKIFAWWMNLNGNEKINKVKYTYYIGIKKCNIFSINIKIVIKTFPYNIHILVLANTFDRI